VGRALRCALATALLHLAGQPGASHAPPKNSRYQDALGNSVATGNETPCQGVVDMRVFYLNNNPDLTRDQLALESEPMTIPKLLTEPESTELLERLQRTRGRVGRQDSRHLRPLGPPRVRWVFGFRLSPSSTSVSLFSAFHVTFRPILRSSVRYTFTVNHLA
jgi:hypothetical protein